MQIGEQMTERVIRNIHSSWRVQKPNVKICSTRMEQVDVLTYGTKEESNMLGAPFYVSLSCIICVQVCNTAFLYRNCCVTLICFYDLAMQKGFFKQFLSVSNELA